LKKIGQLRPHVRTWRKGQLDDVSKILGLSGKPVGVDGTCVEEMVLSGQIEEVARYCESDVLNTYRVWLIYELFRGVITPQELDWSEAQICDFVVNRKTGNPYLFPRLGLRILAGKRRRCTPLGSRIPTRPIT
jgi:hypothetical protein